MGWAKIMSIKGPPGAKGEKGDTGANGAESFVVGSVFMSVIDTNPADLLGVGTWELLDAGKLLGSHAGDLWAWKRTA